MTMRLRRHKQKRVLFIVALTVTAALLTAFSADGINRGQNSHQAKAPDTNVRGYHREQLSQLSNHTTALADSLQAADARRLVTALDEYHDLQSEIIGSCARLVGSQNQSAQADDSVRQDTKDALSQITQLCGDLAPVARYTQDVFRYSRPYLLYNYPSELSIADRQTVSQVVAGAIAGLQNIDNNFVQDPAKGELLTRLEAQQTLLEKITVAQNSGDSAAADAHYQELLENVSADQTNFLNARVYFWNNTIRIDALQRKITQLSQSLE